MKGLLKTLACLLVSSGCCIGIASAFPSPNQTNDLSPVLPETNLPYSIRIENTNITLPHGVHSGVIGVFQGKWVLIAGRLNGLHGFGADPFPPSLQNRMIYVVDPLTGVVASRSLLDPSSGLNQQQIDTLSVTSPETFQDGPTLYIAGGYGIDTPTATFGTKPVLTAVYLPGIIQWVTQPANKNFSVLKNIRQIRNPIFQITGGRMFKLGKTIQLVFGQNFTGVYTPSSNGDYSQQVRQFQLTDTKGQFSVTVLPSVPHSPDPAFRRRDLNVVPVLRNVNNMLQYGLVAYAGVFTNNTGVWTVPVVIDENGNPSMADPNSPATFKQAMNHYASASAGLYSKKYSSMYTLIFGGITYGYYQNGVFLTDTEIPFTSEVTTIQLDKNGNFTQYLMNNQYPVITSKIVNPGNPLLFGAGANFVLNNISAYPNKVINLDDIRQPTVIGYIVGGIASTVPNTSTDADSSASPYIFKVTVVPKG